MEDFANLVVVRKLDHVRPALGPTVRMVFTLSTLSRAARNRQVEHLRSQRIHELFSAFIQVVEPTSSSSSFNQRQCIAWLAGYVGQCAYPSAHATSPVCGIETPCRYAKMPFDKGRGSQARTSVEEIVRPRWGALVCEARAGQGTAQPPPRCWQRNGHVLVVVIGGMNKTKDPCEEPKICGRDTVTHANLEPLQRGDGPEQEAGAADPSRRQQRYGPPAGRARRAPAKQTRREPAPKAAKSDRRQAFPSQGALQPSAARSAAREAPRRLSCALPTASGYASGAWSKPAAQTLWRRFHRQLRRHCAPPSARSRKATGPAARSGAPTRG